MERRILIQLIASAALCIFALSLYGLWFTSVKATSAHANELRMQIQQKTDDSKRIAQARAALDALKANETTVNTYFVSINDIVTFLGQLQSLGQTLGSTVSIISVAADGKEPLGHLTLSVKITGSFDAVVRTLGAIENSPHDIRLVDTTLDTPVTELSTSSSTTPTVWSAAVIFSVGTMAQSTTTSIK